MIDALKSRVPDPCVTCQWGVVGSETNTIATLHVTSPDVGDMGRLVCILFYFLCHCISEYLKLYKARV